MIAGSAQVPHRYGLKFYLRMPAHPVAPRGKQSRRFHRIEQSLVLATLFYASTRSLVK